MARGCRLDSFGSRSAAAADVVNTVMKLGVPTGEFLDHISSYHEHYSRGWISKVFLRLLVSVLLVP
jgi:hypothetical protein